MPLRTSAAVLACLLYFSVPPLTGCAPKSFDSMEPFSRDRIGGLRRSVELTMSTLESAADSSLKAFNESQALCENPGESLDIAYSVARGDLSTAKGRQNSFTRRIKVTQDGGDALFEEWGNEIREYSDDAVAQSSRESLDRLQTAHTAFIKALEAVEDDLVPLIDVVSDRVLYLKHSRNEGPLTTLPAVTPEITGRLERIKLGVENARIAADNFEKATAGQ